MIHKEVMFQSRDEVRAYLEPKQLVLSENGVAKLVFAVRGLLNLHPDWICVKTDIRNCYNEQNCVAILDVLASTSELEHLLTFAAIILAPETLLETGGKVWGHCSTGLIQGDPSSGALQAIGLQPSLVALDRECQAGGGIARGGADDMFAVGPAEVVIPALKSLKLISNRDVTSIWNGTSQLYIDKGVGFLKIPPLASI